VLPFVEMFEPVSELWQPELAPAVGTVWKLSLPLLGLSGVVRSGKFCKQCHYGLDSLAKDSLAKEIGCHWFTAPWIVSANTTDMRLAGQ
jgi:hypothetical protein